MRKLKKQFLLAFLPLVNIVLTFILGAQYGKKTRKLSVFLFVVAVLYTFALCVVLLALPAILAYDSTSMIVALSCMSYALSLIISLVSVALQALFSISIKKRAIVYKNNYSLVIFD